MASGMKLTEKFSNRATPVKHTLIICVPRANLILSGVVFEELTTAWGSIQDCRPLDESLNYQSEPWKWILNGLSYNPVHSDSPHLIGRSETQKPDFFLIVFVCKEQGSLFHLCFWSGMIDDVTEEMAINQRLITMRENSSRPIWLLLLNLINRW